MKHVMYENKCRILVVLKAVVLTFDQQMAQSNCKKDGCFFQAFPAG